MIEGRVEAGDGPLSSRIEDGWLANLDPPVEDGEPGAQGEIEGGCVEERCALSVDHGYGKLTVTGDLLRAGPSEGRFLVTDGEEAKTAEGSVRFTPLTDTVPGLGVLVKPGAVNGTDLTELLLWTGQSSGWISIDDDPPDDFQREALARWQAASGRPATGLILATDLDALRAEAAKARAEAGWAPVGSSPLHYPGALLRSLSASASPGERRFASDDGKVVLIVAEAAPLSEEGWDAFVDAQTGEKAAGESRGYTRINDDMELTRARDGAITVLSFHNGARVFRRLSLTYPEGDERWEVLGAMIQFDFRRANAR